MTGHGPRFGIVLDFPISLLIKPYLCIDRPRYLNILAFFINLVISMRVSVKPAHLAKTQAVSQVAQTPYTVDPPSTADLKKQTRTKIINGPPLTNIERLNRREKRKGKNAELKAEVASLRRTVRARCNELADLYDKKPHYLMDMFYQRSDQAAKNTYEVNAFNAYKSVKAHERREAGETPLHLLELQSTITQDYMDLNDAALEKVVEKYKELRNEDKREKLKRPSVKEKMADVAKSVDTVMTAMQGLKTHCGIEFVGLLVKNRPEPFMNPKWLATDGRIHDYLSLILRGWDPTYIGKKVEAFAVAGCDATKIFKSQKDQAEALKRNLVRIVQDGLDQACGTENQVMQYERFDTTITMRYNVIVEGWLRGIPFQKPSAFGGALEPLIKLRNAWQSGEAHFWKLSDDEFQTWLAQRAEKIEKGDIVLKARKKRSDAGVKRGEKGKGTEASGEKADGEEQAKDSDEGESELEGKGGDTELEDTEHPKKRTKTTVSTTTGKPPKTATKPPRTKTKAAKTKAPRKPRTTRKTSKPADDVEAPDTTADTLPPALIAPNPSAAEIRPRPQPRPVVPRKPAKLVEEENSERAKEGAAPIAPAALDTVADAVNDTQHDAPEAPADELQAPSATSTDTFDYSVMDPTLRPDPSNNSPPVASPIPSPTSEVENEAGATVEVPPKLLKRKRRSEQERLQEDAIEHGATDDKRGRIAVRRRHLGAGSFASKAEGVNSDDEDIGGFELC
ncbi:hypothetical protein V5O48_010510 [Marasmius crinis-equi]|uniref:Uncharacterized protein n=1 Tax=Marasmius crinis-equi TaxID=585013 RepID=A0ABR3F884_9AGAR